MRPLASVSARAGLLALGGAGFWLAFAAASNNWIVDTSSAPEPSWLRGPLAGVLPALNDPSFSALLLIMLAGYALAVVGSSHLPERATLVVVFGLVVLFGLAPIVLSSDLFGYVSYARLDVLHGLNPYLHPPSSAPHDAILPLVFWTDAPSPYGPLFTALSLPVGAASPPLAVWTLKSLSTVSCLLALALIARAAPRYGRSATTAVLLVGGNPLLLVYAVGGGHNDLIVLALTAGALLLLSRPARAAAGGATLALAVAIKLTGTLMLPFALAGAGRERRTMLAGTLAGAVLASAITVPLFGTDVFGQIGRIATGGDYVIEWSGPDALGRLLGTGVTSGVRLACAGVAVLVVLGCLGAVLRGGDWLAAAAIAGLVVLCAIPSLVPWYVAWVLPAAALARGRAVRVGLLALTAVMVLTRLPILGFTDY